MKHRSMIARASPPVAPLDPLTGLEAARFGLYIHFPYCLSKCPYCDFASVVTKQIPEERYTEAILRELELRLGDRPELAGREVHSIFLGGGTPSLWAPRNVGRVLEAVSRRFEVGTGAEITLEANPGASDAERFAGFRAAGINRLSIGVQSFQPELLKKLGRAHSPEQAEAAFRTARQAGFSNVSLDLIYGVQGQTVAQAEADAERASSLGSEHLSAYALTLDKESLAEEVPLAKQLARGEVVLPADEAVVEMNHRVGELFARRGLQRYEISNYARPGYHSRHNALYWTGGEYFALGVGATGFLKDGDGRRTGVRYSNQRSPERYLTEVEAGRAPDQAVEPLGEEELFEERLAMGLRLSKGIDLERLAAEFGRPLKSVEPYVRGGLAKLEGSQLSLTREGADVHSAIAARLI